MMEIENTDPAQERKEAGAGAGSSWWEGLILKSMSRHCLIGGDRERERDWSWGSQRGREEHNRPRAGQEGLG